MSNRIDNRNKIANRDGQEYAHNYPFEGKSEEYQYPNEDKRVGYHAKDPDDDKTTDELYNVQPEATIQSAEQVDNKPKVKFDAKNITEDHRQRSYRIKNTPQVNGKTDLGPSAYELSNDPRQDEINKIKETTQEFANKINQEQSTDLTSPNGRFGLDNNQTQEQEVDTLKAGDQVEDSEMGLKGKVAAVGRNMVSIVWSDNTRERMNFSDASKFLKVAYVDAAQEQVDPIDTTPFPMSELEKTINHALSSVEASDDENTEDNIDIDKVKLQRQVNELKAQVNEIDIQKIKEKAASELIDLMQKKGMLGKSQDEVDLQVTAIMAMNDQSFEAYKNAILGTKTASNDVAEIEALLGDDDYSDIEDGQEFARAKEEMKKATKSSGRSVDGIEMGDTSFFENGGLANFKGNVGDFSAQGGGTSASVESRKLTNANQERKGIQRKADSGLDFSNFNNLQGLTTPINIPNKDLTSRGKFDELFSDIGWSGMPKGGSSKRR